MNNRMLYEEKSVNNTSNIKYLLNDLHNRRSIVLLKCIVLSRQSLICLFGVNSNKARVWVSGMAYILKLHLMVKGSGGLRF